MRPAFILLAFALLVASAFASSVSMDGAIGQDGQLKAKLSFELPPNAGQNLNLSFSSKLQSIVVKDRSGLILTPQIRTGDNFTLIQISVPYDYIELEFTTDGATAKTGADWKFWLMLRSSSPVSDFSASVTLPAGAKLQTSNGAVATKGDLLSLTWTGKNLAANTLVNLRAGYAVEGQASDWLPALAAIAVIALAAFGARWALSRRQTEIQPKHTAKQKHAPAAKKHMPAAKKHVPAVSRKSMPFSAPLLQPAEPAKPKLEENPIFMTLNETDKEIIREISAEGGKTTQARIYMRTHIAKATLSRRLAALENRGLVRRSPKGNTNLLSLTENLHSK